MGNNWSWPCTDREKIKYKASITNNNIVTKQDFIKNDKICSIQVISTSTLSLNKELRQAKFDFLPICICDHPLNREESIIIYQKLSIFFNLNERARYTYISPFSFTGNTVSSWKSLLENDVQNCLENNQKFLGITGYSGNYYLAFYKRPKDNQVKSKVSIVLYEGEINKITLERFLNSSFMDFKSFFTHKNINFFIMEVSDTAEEYTEDPYSVYEVTEKEIESQYFENLIADKIEGFVSSNNEFKGFVIHKSKPFMILKHKKIVEN